MPGANGRRPTKYINGMDWLDNRSSSRSLATTVLGARGSGKSFSIFKELCWGDLLLGIPQLIVDPVGSSAYLLDQVWRARRKMPPEQWRQLVGRIVYLDFGGHIQAEDTAAAPEQDLYPCIPGWPVLFRYGNESAYEVASRPVDMIAALAPTLENAAIEGMASVREVATHAGIVLSALGLQLTELESLLTQTKRWDRQWGLLDEAARRSPEAGKSVEFLRRFSKLKPELQDRRTKSLLNQVRMLQLDPTMRAIFGSTCPLPWQEWEEQGKCVIADFQRVRDLDRRRWCMMAVYDQFVGYKLSQGLRSTPWSFLIEEFTQLIPSGEAGEAMADKIYALFGVYGRNHQIYSTIISQELFGLPERLREVLLAAGNVMIANQASTEGRRILGDYFFPYSADGMPPKRLEPIYAGGKVVDYRPVDWSLSEYRALASQAFVQPGWHFLVKAAKREGDTSGGLQQMVVQRHLGEWVQEEAVAQLRRLLVKRSGRPRQEVLAEIEGRVDCLVRQVAESATLAEVTPLPPIENDDLSATFPDDVEISSDGFVPGTALRI